MSSEYNWKLLWRDSQKGKGGGHYGHSFWEDAISGRVSVKDMSGDLPHLTDDGALWVDHSRPVTFTLSEYGSNQGYAALPVITERGDRESFVGMRWIDGIEACRRLKLMVEVGPEVGELLRLISEIMIVAVTAKEVKQ